MDIEVEVTVIKVKQLSLHERAGDSYGAMNYPQTVEIIPEGVFEVNNLEDFVASYEAKIGFETNSGYRVSQRTNDHWHTYRVDVLDTPEKIREAYTPEVASWKRDEFIKIHHVWDNRQDRENMGIGGGTRRTLHTDNLHPLRHGVIKEAFSFKEAWYREWVFVLEGGLAFHVTRTPNSNSTSFYAKLISSEICEDYRKRDSESLPYTRFWDFIEAYS